MKHNTYLYIFLTFVSISIFISCKKDITPSNTDAELYEMSKNSSGITYFKNSEELLDKSSGTGHSQPLLRTRYNEIAASKLDVNGKIIEGAIFPEGSLIVKELFTNSTTLDQYAILYKNMNSPDADENGWVWGYLKANGDVVVSASKKGSSCINCHTQSENIDYMLMNKYFP